MLEKRVIHDCTLPEVEDVAAEHRWTCPDCGSKWAYGWGSEYDKTVTKGMLWWRTSRVEHVVTPGCWWRESWPVSWEPV